MTSIFDGRTNDHIAVLLAALEHCQREWDRAREWGSTLAERLPAGGRLLVAGNGGSAAQAQHLTAEIVGRYSRERRPFSAIALHADSSAVTAITNDYGAEEMFARQVQAHACDNAILLLMSTSGRSMNLVRAAGRGRDLGLTVWAMTGPLPNPLSAVAAETLAIDTPTTAAVQELHLVAVHLMCEAMDACLLDVRAAAAS